MWDADIVRWDWWVEGGFCDCLGCLLDAQASGELTGEDISAFIDANNPPQAHCPKCDSLGYVSEYEPDMLHCPSCGVYSFRQGHDSAWVPAIQGVKHPR